MTNVFLKNVPNIRLEQVLKRRKTNLKSFINDAGIQTYVGLLNVCSRMGVEPPTEELYNQATSNKLNTDPQEGIIVIGNDQQQPVEVDDKVDEPKKRGKKKKQIDDASEQLVEDLVNETNE